MDREYSNIDATRSNQWLEKQESGSKRSKWIVCLASLPVVTLHL
jgi:hypothetical protein